MLVVDWNKLKKKCSIFIGYNKMTYAKKNNDAIQSSRVSTFHILCKTIYV